MQNSLPATSRLIKAPAMATVASIDHNNHKLLKSATVRKDLPPNDLVMSAERQSKKDSKRKTVKVVFSQAIIAD